MTPPRIDGLGCTSTIRPAMFEGLARRLADAGWDGLQLLLEQQLPSMPIAREVAARSREVGINCIPTVDVGHQHADDACRFICDAGFRAFSLSSIGSFRSPMRAVDVESVESYPYWRRASDMGQMLVVRPTTEDATLLVLLADAFPDVHVLIRGGLASWRTPGAVGCVREWPLPDRFTFDRLHQLPNVSLIFAPAQLMYPPQLIGDAQGWHRPSNLLALFSERRIMWASECHFDDVGAYRPPQDVEDAFGSVTAVEKDWLMGGTARRLFGGPH